ncbi:MAG: hypothetical protein ABIZ80_11430 [Bryobacteraceae bacterium]
MTFRILVVAAMFVSYARPAETGIRGSILGFVFDPAHGVQPIFGIAGAATIGPPLKLGAQITGLATSSQQNYALAKTASDSNFVRIDFGEPGALLPLGVPAPAAGLAVVSPMGSAAAFYDRERNRILVIRGLPDAAAVASDVDVTGFPEVISLAVNDSADAVLFAFADAEMAARVDDRFVSLGLRGTAMRFLSASREAVIADAAASTVYLLKNLAGAPEVTVLADSIPEPVAVASSSDNKRVFVASSVSGTVTGIELASGGVTVTSCACRPSTLADLNGNAIFRLTEPSGSPLWVFDADAPEPRIVFVPPYRSVTESEAQ